MKLVTDMRFGLVDLWIIRVWLGIDATVGKRGQVSLVSYPVLLGAM
jgi:hypothetical protein